MQISTAADPKVVARSIAIGRGRTDTEKNELIRNRKKYVYKKKEKKLNSLLIIIIIFFCLYD